MLKNFNRLPKIQLHCQRDLEYTDKGDAHGVMVIITGNTEQD